MGGCVLAIKADINSSKCMKEEMNICARSMHVITNCVGGGRLVLTADSQKPTLHESKSHPPSLERLCSICACAHNTSINI